jgi:hypothetical protein
LNQALLVVNFVFQRMFVHSYLSFDGSPKF